MTTVPATRPPRAPAPLPMTPGRWLTLMIGVPVALALIGWTGFSLVTDVGQASYPVTGPSPWSTASWWPARAAATSPCARARPGAARPG